VIADERSARCGKVIEVIGHYNPLMEPSSFTVDKEKTLEWIKKGAIPTDTVRKMLGKCGVLKAIDFSASKKRAPKGQEEKKDVPEAKPAEVKTEEKK